MMQSKVLGRLAALLILSAITLGCGGSTPAPAPAAPAPAAPVQAADAAPPEPPDAPDINIGSGGTTINGNAVTSNATLNGLNLLSPKVFGAINGFTLQLRGGAPFTVTDVQIPFAAGTLEISGANGAAVTWQLAGTAQTAYNSATYGGDFQWPANLMAVSTAGNLTYTANGTQSTTPIANLQNIRLQLTRP